MTSAVMTRVPASTGVAPRVALVALAVPLSLQHRLRACGSTVGRVALRTAASPASPWRAHCGAASCDCAAGVLTPMSISTRSGRTVTLASPVTRIEDTGAAGVCARAGETATAHASVTATRQRMFSRAQPMGIFYACFVRQFIVWAGEARMLIRRGIQRHMASAEIHVAPDRFEVSSGEALLVAELRSAIAVCVYDADEEAGALLHLRCIVRHSKPADVTDTTLATELLLLHRCLESLRESAPAARCLQARIVVHLADTPQVNPACDIVIKLVRHYLEDAGVQVLPEDIAAGPVRTLRFRPAMGWVHTRA